MIYPRSFYINTYGCTFNQADSEKLNRLLLDANYLPTSIEHAEFIIINTCAVKSQTEAKIFHKIRSLDLHDEQKMLITGCLPWISDNTLEKIKKANPKIKAIFGPNSYSQLVTLLDTPLSGDIPVINDPKTIQKASILPIIPPLGKPGIIQISEGCNMSCTYCCTRISRGKQLSYPLNDILQQIQFYLDHGVKEIFLTGQDCGFYDWNSLTIVDLVKKINKLFSNKEVLFRIGMINPIRALEIIKLGQLIQSSPIFYNFLHIPIQSASNQILQAMQRGYTNQLLHTLFQSLETLGITISTDIICGFPHETEEDFLETYNFIQKYQPDIVNISKFTPRPNTEAKKMKQLDSSVVKKRTHQLSQLYHRYSVNKNAKWRGWKGQVFIHAYHPEKKYMYSGRNISYKSVVVPKAEVNSVVIAKIIDSSGQILIGEILDE